MTKRQDRRVRRTNERLQRALMSLIGEKSYDKITVSDLIDRADVGRSTFYAHYETKDDLLLAGLEYLTSDIEQYVTDDPGAGDAVLPSFGIFQHVSDNHQRFRRLLGSRGIDLVQRAALDMLTEMALSRIEERAADGERSEIPATTRAAFAAGSLMAFVAWWLDNDMPHSPEEMADMYRRMTASI